LKRKISELSSEGPCAGCGWLAEFYRPTSLLGLTGTVIYPIYLGIYQQTYMIKKEARCQDDSECAYSCMPLVPLCGHDWQLWDDELRRDGMPAVYFPISALHESPGLLIGTYSGDNLCTVAAVVDVCTLHTSASLLSVQNIN
jgi:hypothetical protein